MCGIVGNITNKPIKDLLINGLTELEYRGYDSVGIATIGSDNKISIIKNKGKIKDFANKYQNISLQGNLGIGHTRWATHGIPSETNAHPIFDSDKKLAVVHNGIIENYLEIKKDLIKDDWKTDQARHRRTTLEGIRYSRPRYLERLSWQTEASQTKKEVIL